MTGSENPTLRSRGASDDHRWAIVLAGGDGTRLHSLTTSRLGIPVPKQFCSLDGGPSLLRQALDRAAAVVPADRILVVVAESHRRWWASELAQLPPDNLVVQPGNRGTAAGILLPLLRLLDRDPLARLLAVPSDHFVADEGTLAAAARRALQRVQIQPRIVLLGIRPDVPETDFGWIVPARRSASRIAGVATFVEKPDRARAAELMRRGAVWNSFLLAAGAAHLVDCFRRALPELVAALDHPAARTAGAEPSRWLRRTYLELPTRDFSRHLLEHSTDALEVLSVAGCGWSDLGTPQRVASCLRRLGFDGAPTLRRLCPS